jgi:hypothetical protein
VPSMGWCPTGAWDGVPQPFGRPALATFLALFRLLRAGPGCRNGGRCAVCAMRRCARWRCDKRENPVRATPDAGDRPQPSCGCVSRLPPSPGRRRQAAATRLAMCKTPFSSTRLIERTGRNRGFSPVRGISTQY